MIRTKKRMGLCAALLILNLAFIWGNSLLSGSVSGAFSQWVRDLLARIFQLPAKDPSAGHGLLRKIAHFTEFCSLGLCLTWLTGMLGKRPWVSLACGFLAACADETIQCFVPDRGPGFRDVLIDTAGAALGIVLLLAGHRFLRQRRKPQTFGGQQE